MAAAADVPALYDLVIQDASGTNGYVLVKDDATGLFYRPRRASYGTTPTFLERTNVQGDYGDDQQQFWMTFSQKDWSLGEGQKFFRSNDPDRVRRYWTGTDIDVTTTPGQAVARFDRQLGVTSTSSTITALTYQQKTASFFAADSTTLFSFPDAGSAITSIGAHGAGAISAITYDAGHFPMATDNQNVYIAGGTKIRKYNGSVFSDFSTTSTATSLAFLNNTLYSTGFTTGTLDRYDTSGVKSTLFTWKGATGAAIAPTQTFFPVPYGGKLVIVLDNELWLYDGNSPAKIADLPIGFRCFSACVSLGILYLGGRVSTPSTSPPAYQAAVYYYASGNLGQLWRADGTTRGWASVAPSPDGLFIYDSGVVPPKLRLYTAGTGGVSSIATMAGTDTAGKQLAASDSGVAVINALTIPTRTGVNYYPATTISATATVTTSLFDGDSALDKYFKAVKVDFDTAGGGTVDISYKLNTVSGGYTSLQTNATAGTEYTIGQTARSISIQVTLNAASQTDPTLKRIYVRAVPLLQQFRKNEYILELSGQDGKVPVKLRNGQLHNVDGMSMAQNLRTSIASTTPITVTDRFGTYTGIIEPDNSSIIEVRPEIFQAHIVIREI